MFLRDRSTALTGMLADVQLPLLYSPRLRGFVQTSLPSLAMVAFNNFLPFMLEGR